MKTTTYPIKITLTLIYLFLIGCQSGNTNASKYRDYNSSSGSSSALSYYALHDKTGSTSSYNSVSSSNDRSQYADAKAEYREALSTYNEALESLNKARSMAEVNQMTSSSMMSSNQGWIRGLSAFNTMTDPGAIRNAERNVEIARQRLDRARARQEALEWK
ncbi:hypothetical protein ACFL6U_08825 [Planctomycetota bacterium]